MRIAWAARSSVYAVVLSIALTAAACAPGRSAGSENGEADSSGAADNNDPNNDPNNDTAAGPSGDQPDPGQLVVDFDRETVRCDGANHSVGEIRGALPGERILFSSPVPIDTPEINADQSGRFDMVWRCSEPEARLQWEIKAVGHDSGRAVTFTIVGTESAPANDNALIVDIINEPFVCDGITRPIGTIANAFANEQVGFTSPESSDLKPGKANDFGELRLHWECEPAQAGTTWNVTATGIDSGRGGFFVIAGVARKGETIPDPIIDVTEEPFVCDGGKRGFATIQNLAPHEIVDFSSPDSEGLIDGRANEDGTITVNWQCGIADVGKVWRLTATGVSSQREVMLVITGAPPPETPETTAAVTYVENPFGCDGTSRVFATISNLIPLEFVGFESPQSGTLRQGQADEIGNLPVRWQCGAADIDKIWDVTATGATSGRTVTMQITGGSPQPD